VGRKGMRGGGLQEAEGEDADDGVFLSPGEVQGGEHRHLVMGQHSGGEGDPRRGTPTGSAMTTRSLVMCRAALLHHRFTGWQ